MSLGSWVLLTALLTSSSPSRAFYPEYFTLHILHTIAPPPQVLGVRPVSSFCSFSRLFCLLLASSLLPDLSYLSGFSKNVITSRKPSLTLHPPHHITRLIRCSYSMIFILQIPYQFTCPVWPSGCKICESWVRADLSGGIPIHLVSRAQPVPGLKQVLHRSC